MEHEFCSFNAEFINLIEHNISNIQHPQRKGMQAVYLELLYHFEKKTTLTQATLTLFAINVLSKWIQYQ